jgi:hypothetical protein
VTKVRKRRSPLANQFPFEFSFANPFGFGKGKYPKINSKPFAEADSPQTLPAVSNFANPWRFGKGKYPKINSTPFA